MRRFLTVSEASEYLGVKEGTLYQWKSQGRIQCVKLYGCLRFDKLYLDELIKQSTIQPINRG